MKLKSIQPMEPKAARCIEVDSPDKLFAAGGNSGKAMLSHNSVVQRNIIFSCILRPQSWRFLGIDLKKVELSAFRQYSNVVLGIATTLEDALIVLRFAQETMMKRYAEMEQMGINNFLSLPKKGQALMVMVDEAGELLSPSGVKALSENTPIPTPQGFTTMKNLTIGTTIYDNYTRPTQVTNKYQPQEQDRHKLTISKDSTKEKETIIAGSEHNWVVYFKNPKDASLQGPEIMDTAALQAFHQAQKTLPLEARTQVKFKKYEEA